VSTTTRSPGEIVRVIARTIDTVPSSKPTTTGNDRACQIAIRSRSPLNNVRAAVNAVPSVVAIASALGEI
jgi:hypothetical protein